MGGEALRIGPFSGGLNLASDPTSVADTELMVCRNFELNIDTSLQSRPAYETIVLDEDEWLDQSAVLIGNASFAGVGYLFASNSTRIYQSTDGVQWTALDAVSRASRCCAQYKGKVWFPTTPGSANPGISWDPVGGVTEIATMPRGESCVMHKERLFICPGTDASVNESRLYFSNAGNVGVWTIATDFADIAPGDGSSLNGITVFQDNLILFKDDSTFALTYDISPSEAIVREINSIIGMDQPFNLTQFENTIYCGHRGKVYEIVNLDFEAINVKVPFEYDLSVAPSLGIRIYPTSLSLVGDRLICRYFNRTYVFGLRTRTWSEWRNDNPTYLAHNHGPFVKLPKPFTTFNLEEYYANLSFAEAEVVIRMVDGWNASSDESGGVINALIKTKNFDMADPTHYKKLYMWSADILSGGEVEGIVTPVVLGFTTTWNELDGILWNNLNTWDALQTTVDSITDALIGSNTLLLRKTVKFLKALRFRQVNFQLKLTTDGTSTQGPVRIFALIAHIRTAQATVKKVS